MCMNEASKVWCQKYNYRQLFLAMSVEYRLGGPATSTVYLRKLRHEGVLNKSGILTTAFVGFIKALKAFSILINLNWASLGTSI